MITSTLVRQHPLTKQPPAGVNCAPLLFTKELADYFLSNTDDNYRKMDDMLAARYARDMSANRWNWQGDSIKTTIDEQVMDGQHRLKAISICGIPQWFYHISGMPNISTGIATQDTGRKRDLSCHFAHRKKQFPAIRAACCRRLIAIYRNLAFCTSVSARPTEQEVVDFDAHHEAMLDTVLGYLNTNCKRCATPTSCSVSFAVAHMADAERASQFIRVFNGTVSADTRHPAVVCYNHLLSQRAAGNTLEDTDVVALFGKAWNAWIANREIKRLMLRADEKVQYTGFHPESLAWGE